MKIKLIVPSKPWASSFSCAKFHMVQQVNLPLLAALTPPGHSVKIVDESFAPDDPQEEVDLVGITVMTALARRAYRIAAGYRARGVKVVMGGIHPSALPGETLQHSDAVVIGEGETVWPQLVQDVAAGKMRAVYRASTMTDLSGLPFPRRSLYPRPARMSITPTGVGIETARGCPFDCEFCSVARLLGKKYRRRPVEDVIREMESIPSRNLFFVDDSLGLDREAGKRLFAEMIPLRKYWIGQGLVSLAEDTKLLRLMKNSGGQGLLIGFESVDDKAPDHLGKLRAMKITLAEAVHRFHEEGLSLMGSFIFGFDHEDKSIFERTIEFVKRHKIDGLNFGILCPLPGTRLYDRLVQENRLFDPAWWLKDYPPFTLLYRLKGMTPDEFFTGLGLAVKELLSYKSIFSRFLGISPWRRSIRSLSIYAGVNYSIRRRYYNDTKIPQPFYSQSVIRR